jgi:hypothetical protein
VATKKTPGARPKKKRTEDPIAPVPEVVADVWGSGVVPKVLCVVSAIYLGSVAFDGIGSTLPHRVLPQAAEFFAQCSCLFPKAADFSIDYRAEGFRCSDKRWVEIDPRPFFPIDRDEKESRFQRTLHFYKDDRPTMQALEDFLIKNQNETVLGGGSPLGGGPIGGVRFLSLRIPIGQPGEALERYAHKPLLEYSENEQHEWYHTPQSRREERCKP